MKKTVCLLSGGLDSATTLYRAQADGYQCIALTVDYRQAHRKEIEYAKRLAAQLGIEHHIVPLSLPWGGSALLDRGIQIPVARELSVMASEIPATYVPARNIIFLSLASSLAEVKKTEAVHIGVNALDYSGYPDCREPFLRIFAQMIQTGTKAGTEGKTLEIKAPLLRLNKNEIILLGKYLGVPFENTWSCYQGKERPCGECDACKLRAKGFSEASVADPLLQNGISSGN